MMMRPTRCAAAAKQENLFKKRRRTDLSPAPGCEPLVRRQRDGWLEARFNDLNLIPKSDRHD